MQFAMYAGVYWQDVDVLIPPLVTLVKFVDFRAHFPEQVLEPIRQQH